MRKPAPRGAFACTRSLSVSGIQARAVWPQGGSGCWGQRAAGWGLSEQMGGMPRATSPVKGARGLGRAPLEASLPLGTAGRQFPRTADPVLFNLELKCKQGSEPAAPTPNRIQCCDLSAAAAACLPGRGGKAGTGARPFLWGSQLSWRDLPPKLNFNPGHRSSRSVPCHPLGPPPAAAGPVWGQPHAPWDRGHRGLPALGRGTVMHGQTWGPPWSLDTGAG